MLRYRILTALVLLPLVLAAILAAPAHVFAAVVLAAMMAVAWEWGRACSPYRAYRMAMPLLLLLLGAAMHSYPVLHNIVLISGLLLWVFCPLWLYAKWRVAAVPKAAIGLLVIASAGAALIALKEQQTSGWLVLSVFLFVWASDVGAYIAGKLVGRHKLAPVISPGKTWEGVVGGIALCLAVGVAIDLWLPVPGTLVDWLMLAAASFVVSVFGDLAESLLKRQAGIKDSGFLLPGHGGFLDRLDSLLAAAPVFWLLAGWFGFFALEFPGF